MLSDDEIEKWKRDLESGDRYRQAEAAEVLSKTFTADDTDVDLTVCDKLWKDVDKIGDFIELTYTIPRNLAPQATLTLRGNHHLVPMFRTCRRTMVGVILETAGIYEAFYVKRHREKMGEDGVLVHVIELVGIFDILNYLVIWPSWWSPIQAQPFSHAIYAAPLCTAIEAMAAEQALRIQSGMSEFVNNALSLNPDVRAWFGTVLQGLKRDGKPSTILKTPLYVVRTAVCEDRPDDDGRGSHQGDHPGVWGGCSGVSVASGDAAAGQVGAPRSRNICDDGEGPLPNRGAVQEHSGFGVARNR